MRTYCIYLDDTRPTPHGWIGCRWPQEVIRTIEDIGSENIACVSLDHDLGEEGRGARTGKDVLTWMMDQVINNPEFVLPTISIHTANAYEKGEMKKTARRIRELYLERKKPVDFTESAEAVVGVSPLPQTDGEHKLEMESHIENEEED